MKRKLYNLSDSNFNSEKAVKVNGIDVYTYNDNLDLIREYRKTKDPHILDIILIVNYKLIKKQARRYKKVIEGTSLGEDDLIQVGYIGLLRAIEKFNIRKKTSFSTYALYWIKQSMTREISNKTNSIRIPVYMVEEIIRLRKAQSELDPSIGYKEKVKRICDILGIDEKRYEELKSYENLFGGKLLSLNMEVGDEEDIALSELISIDESDDTVFDAVSLKMLRENIMIALKTLSEREADILMLRYGISDGRERTLEDIGKKYNLTRERVRQIEAKALWKLKNKKNIRILKDGYIKSN